MINKIEDLKLAVIGLGYVGLPLALEFSKKKTVIGFDINKSRVNQLKSGLDKNLEFNKKELQKALQMIDEKDEKKIKIIEELTKAVVESIVSTPMNNIRKASEQGQPDVLELASRLFDYKKTKSG